MLEACIARQYLWSGEKLTEHCDGLCLHCVTRRGVDCLRRRAGVLSLLPHFFVLFALSLFPFSATRAAMLTLTRCAALACTPVAAATLRTCHPVRAFSTGARWLGRFEEREEQGGAWGGARCSLPRPPPLIPLPLPVPQAPAAPAATSRPRPPSPPFQAMSSARASCWPPSKPGTCGRTGRRSRAVVGVVAGRGRQLENPKKKKISKTHQRDRTGQ